MTLSMKVGGAWKEAQSLHVKIGGEWKEISELYSKKDGVWATVYSGGALIEFTNYPYPIPVAAGWKYSLDGGSTWVDITEDTTFNPGEGTLSGLIKAKGELILNEYYQETTVIDEPGYRMNGEPLSIGRTDSTSFVNNSKGYVCGGQINTSSVDHAGSAVVDVYDSSGTRTTGTPLSVARGRSTSFVNNSKGYVCGGYNSETVDVYDSSGNRTTGTSLSCTRHRATSFANNSKGYVCGGYIDATVDVYDSSGNRTAGNSMSISRNSATSFVNSLKGYVCGGTYGYTYYSNVDVYNSSGTRTTGKALSVGRSNSTSFVNRSKGYVCGGFYVEDTYYNTYPSNVDVYNSSGTRTTGNALSVGRASSTSFANNSKGYVCGGYGISGGSYTTLPTVDMYDSSGNRTTGTSMSQTRNRLTSFVTGSKGYVCGGNDSDVYSTVDVYYDRYETFYSTNIPITKGSEYTLNGTTATATESTTLSFDSKVTGTIKYKKGTVPT